MPNRMTHLPAVAFLALWLAGAVSGQAAESAAKEPSNPFAGKYVSVITKSEPGYTIDLSEVKIVRLGDQSFLVGVGVQIEDAWYSGREVWVAVSDVSTMTVFPSLEKLLESIEELNEPAGEEPDART